MICAKNTNRLEFPRVRVLIKTCLTSQVCIKLRAIPSIFVVQFAEVKKTSHRYLNLSKTFKIFKTIYTIFCQFIIIDIITNITITMNVCVYWVAKIIVDFVLEHSRSIAYFKLATYYSSGSKLYVYYIT